MIYSGAAYAYPYAAKYPGYHAPIVAKTIAPAYPYSAVYAILD